MSGMRALCRVEELADGTSRGFEPPAPGGAGLFVVRQGGTVFAYVNLCPHLGTPLDWAPGRFLSRDGSQIVCATHGALFEIEDGTCVAGPCLGDQLDAIPVTVEDGVILVPADAGQ